MPLARRSIALASGARVSQGGGAHGKLLWHSGRRRCAGIVAVRIPVGASLHEKRRRSRAADHRLRSRHPRRGPDRSYGWLLRAWRKSGFSLMHKECPKCGCKLSAFDVEETEHCPSCGLRFSETDEPLGSQSELDLPSPSKVTGCIKTLLIAFAFIIGLLLVFLALAFSECSRSHNYF